MTKTILIQDAEGNPLAGAHIIPEDGESTISNSAGVAIVEVNDQNTWVDITHVSGTSVTIPFFDLPSTLVLGDNELDAVYLDDKKKSYLGYWIAAVGLVAVIAASKNKPVKVKL